MRIINKKYLLIIILVGVILTGVIVEKPNKKVKLDNVILKQEVNNKTFAMYKETDSGYEEYKDTKFPDMYVLNIEKSKCIDNNGNELENVLSYENNEVVLTTNKSSYCYLYFDKSLGLEIKEKEPKGLSIDKIRGAMYRFQGQAKDSDGKELVNNYICFGTSEKDACTKDQDHHMYRIIGIEASTGRVKVIKKEALNETYQWHTEIHGDIKYPNSIIYNAINGESFLENNSYVPEGWKEKIVNTTWLYGDMWEESTDGVQQDGLNLYEVESGKKEVLWYIKSTVEDGGIPHQVEWSDNDLYGTTLYYKEQKSFWKEQVTAKIGLMYLHDYELSLDDISICDIYQGEEVWARCKASWMHLSQNDPNAPNGYERTICRGGWVPAGGTYNNIYINDGGMFAGYDFAGSLSVRPVFYINASEELLSGNGTITDPFIIKS